MNLNTQDEREYEILKIIENDDEIGPSQIHKITGIPKKTLYKYLDELIEKGILSKIKKGNKSNSKVQYVVNFSEGLKKQIKHNVVEISNYHNTYHKTKILKSNTFPHYLERLSLQYYQNMVSFLFDNVSIYKYGVKQIEEILQNEKIILNKKFKGKNKQRLHQACQEIQRISYGRTGGSIRDAEDRTIYRTRDEIEMDSNQIEFLFISEHNEKNKQNNYDLKDSRVSLLSNNDEQKEWIELSKEYNTLSQQLMLIKTRMATISGSRPFEPKMNGIPNDDLDFFYVN